MLKLKPVEELNTEGSMARTPEGREWEGGLEGDAGVEGGVEGGAEGGAEGVGVKELIMSSMIVSMREL